MQATQSSLLLATTSLGADELTFLDVSASKDGRGTMIDVVKRTADQVFIPLTVGGGVRSVSDVRELLRAGADKVSVNSSAIARPELLRELADVFGSQCIVLSVDARRCAEQPSGFEVTTHGGTKSAGLDAIEWAVRGAELGVGRSSSTPWTATAPKSASISSSLKSARGGEHPVIASGGRARRSTSRRPWPRVPTQYWPPPSSTSVRSRSRRSRTRLPRPLTRCASEQPRRLRTRPFHRGAPQAQRGRSGARHRAIRAGRGPHDGVDG